MSLKIGNKNVESIKYNGHRVIEGKLNGEIVFQFEGTPYMSFEINADSFRVPFWNGNYGNNLSNLVILWGDGESTTITDGNITKEDCMHSYQTSGSYTIYIYSYNGKIPQFNFSLSSGEVDPEPISDYAQYITKFNTPLLPMIRITGIEDVDLLAGIFKGCSNLESVPNDLFSLNSNATNLSHCFDGCSKLKVPLLIFNQCTKITNLSYSLRGTVVSGQLPLLSNLLELKDVSYAFSEIDILALSLTYLFDNNSKLENVEGAFSNITKNTLTSLVLPEGFFRNNKKITNFSKCFYNSPNLTLNENIFCNQETESSTRFLNMNVDFTSMFESDSTSGLFTQMHKGIAPSLWNYVYGSAIGTNCFGGTANKTLKNYYYIPKDWGGSYIDNSMSITIQGSNYVIPFTNGTYDIGDIIIDWGDNSTSTIENGVVTNRNRRHVYSAEGTYDITISNENGKIPNFSIGQDGTFGTNVVSINTPLLTMVGTDSEPIINTTYTFANSSLVKVCDELYKNNSQIIYLVGDFYNCNNLITLPSSTFYSLTSLNTIEFLFAKSRRSSSEFLELPNDIFSRNVNIENFDMVFQNGTIKTIPEELFANNTKIKSFSHTFDNCYVQDGVLRQNLFRYNINVEDFTSTFADCYIKEIPEYFLKYNTKATSFNSMFSKSVSTAIFPATIFLQINKNIFCNEATEIETRFANMTVSFSGMFEDRSIEGTAPSLWKYNYSNVDGANCFKMSNFITSYSKLTNGGEIPVEWGGNYIENTMKLTIDTTKVSADNVDFSLPFNAGEYELIDSLFINWGDGENTTISTGNITNEDISHSYSSSGTYQITIMSPNGNVPNFGIYNDWTQVISLDTPLLSSLSGYSTSTYITQIKFNHSNIKKIADRLFYFNPQITSLSEAFLGSPLEKIPYGLFIDLNNLNSVSSCFSNCTMLTIIPFDMFRYNPNITNFNSCFNGCSSVTNIGINLFCDENTEKETRFSQLPVDFTNCFSSCGGGTLDIDLWNYNYFYVSSSNALNWKDNSLLDKIPEAWGGTKRELDIIINGNSFILPLKIGTYSKLGNISVDWDDGQITNLSSPITLENISHTYASSSNYKIRLVFSTNTIPVFSFSFTDITNRQKITRINGVLPLMINTDDAGADTKMVDFTSMFEECVNLKTITNSNFLSKNNSGNNTKGYSSAENMFYHSGLVYAGMYDDSLFYNVNCNNYQNCFYGCSNLTTVPYIPGALIYNNCFNGCSKLDFDTNVIYDIFERQDNQQFNYCFANCTSLTSVPSFLFEGDNLQLSGTFYNCVNLKTAINVFSNVKSLDYSSCFQNCNRLFLDKNLFSYTDYGFENLEEGQTVDMTYLFSIQRYIGTSIGTAPEIWNYPYLLTNYTNIYTQENIKEQTSSGVDISFNQDSTIKINGIATEQTIFESNLFTFGINPNKWYNATLIKNSGDFSNITENGIKIQLLNENNVEFYSNIFKEDKDFNKWKGVSFAASNTNSFKVVITVYNGVSYNNLSITPKLTIAQVNPTGCFSGHSTNSLTNYNDIPSLWK